MMNDTLYTDFLYPGPDTRGTIGLFWSCIATVFLCTWTVWHPNLPTQKDTQWTIFSNRCEYFLLGLIAPEWITFEALIEVFEAWSIKHKYPNWSLTQAFYLVMGGFVADDGIRRHRLRPQSFMKLMDQKILDWPVIDESEILDRSKADWTMKILALIQTGYFVAQALGRYLLELPITPIEFYTLGTIVCGVSTLLAWWKKPFDIHKPTICPAKQRLPNIEEVHNRLNLTDVQSNWAWPLVITIYVSAAFSGMHLFGLGFSFPTGIEWEIWKLTTIACIGVPFFVAAALISFGKRQNNGTPPPDWAYGILYLLILGYVLCRLVMMVETFYCMRAVSLRVYETPRWLDFIPRFG